MWAQRQAGPAKRRPPARPSLNLAVPPGTGRGRASFQPDKDEGFGGRGGITGLEEPLEQSRVGTRDDSIWEGPERAGTGQDPTPTHTQSSGSWRGQETDRWACWAGFLSGRHQPGLPTSLQSQTRPGLGVIWGALGALGRLGGSEVVGAGMLQQEGLDFHQGRGRWRGLPVRHLNRKAARPARAAQVGRGAAGAPHEPRVPPAPRGPSPPPPRGLRGRRCDPRCPSNTPCPFPTQALSAGPPSLPEGSTWGTPYDALSLSTCLSGNPGSEGLRISDLGAEPQFPRLQRGFLPSEPRTPHCPFFASVSLFAVPVFFAFLSSELLGALPGDPSPLSRPPSGGATALPGAPEVPQVGGSVDASQGPSTQKAAQG